MNPKTIIATGGENSRLDKFLSTILSDLSRTQIQKMIKDGLVLVDGQPSKAGWKLNGRETIVYTIPEIEPEIEHIEPENIPLDVLFEDDDIIAINKPPGLVVHPGVGQKSGTLVHALTYHFSQLSNVNGQLRPGIVHRLDQNTSGVILVAKNNQAHADLASQFEQRKIQKEYTGFTWGNWTAPNGIIDGSIKRKRSDPTAYEVNESGRHALTQYQVEVDGSVLSQISFFPKTGRTHQLRVHAASMHHPIFGDDKYGGGVKRTKGFVPEITKVLTQLLKKINRHALHARKITFQHPSTQKEVAVSAPIPEDLTLIIQAMHLLNG